MAASSSLGLLVKEKTESQVRRLKMVDSGGVMYFCFFFFFYITLSCRCLWMSII